VANIFVTGTDTDVGKTVISAWVCLNTTAKYWKPIQTGDDADREIVEKISPHTEVIPEAYQLNAPLSPYDAAKLENSEIRPDLFSEIIGREKSACVIEGSGGVLVPICENFYMADLIKKCNARALLVVKSRLGMINHALASVEALRRRDVDILGMVINGEIEPQLQNTLEKFSQAKVLQIMPFAKNLWETLKNVKLPPEISEAIA
jgi:dethiobiotin synthetase/malonyl-CoA O-methyltransferase